MANGSRAREVSERHAGYTRLGLLIVLSLLLTTTLQSWVGAVTLYSGGSEPYKLAVHRAIRFGELPEDSTYASLGAAGTNSRVLVVYLAEAVHSATGLSILFTYRAIDSVCLFTTFILLFLYLRRWLPDVYCLVGVLYVAISMVLTYFLHIFHPWDRIGVVGWLALLAAMRDRRFAPTMLLLAVCMTIKYDVMFVPLLYAWFTYEPGARRRWLGRSLATGATAALTVLALARTFSSGHGAGDTISSSIRGESLLAVYDRYLRFNLDSLLDSGLGFPPILVFSLPLALGAVGILRRDRFVGCCALFALASFVPYLLFSHFQEVRAEMPLLVLLLPASLLGLRELLEGGAAATPPPAYTAPRSPRPGC